MSSRKTQDYFGIGKGSGIVPANANLLGFIVVNERLRRRKLDKIPFQYLERMPNWQKEANYEENVTIGRFEPMLTYSNSTSGTFEIVCIYVAEASYPTPLEQGTLERQLKNQIKGYNKKNKLEAIEEIKNGKSVVNVVDDFLKEGTTEARKLIDKYLRDVYSPQAKPKSHWTAQYIDSLVVKLKSLVFPQYDGNFSPPNKVLFNAGDLFVDYPLVIKSINVEHEGPFRIDNMMPMTYKITMSCVTNYPLYQALSGSRIYSGVEGSAVFAQKKFSAMKSSILEEDF
jgi:hypothetical protein